MFKSAINVIRNSVACTKEIINYELLQNIWGILLKRLIRKAALLKLWRQALLEQRKYRKGNKIEGRQKC